MIEIVIESWTNADKSVDFRWSAWRDGRRIAMGGAHPTAESSETEARRFCLQELGGAPDRVTRL